MLVLLVDDEQSLLDIFSQTLIAGGMQVVTASNGKDGFDKAKTQKPDIVLLDQVLPDMNGNQVLQLLKKDPDTKNIPVAMLSNFTQNGLVDEAINAGALDYILKYQIEPKDLIAKVNDLIREHSSKPGLTENQLNTGTANSTQTTDSAQTPVESTPQVAPAPVVPEPVMPTEQTIEQPAQAGTTTPPSPEPVVSELTPQQVDQPMPTMPSVDSQPTQTMPPTGGDSGQANS